MRIAAQYMPTDLIVLIAALLITWLVFTWFVKVLKASISAALFIATIVLILQVYLGVRPQRLWQQIIQLPEMIWQLFGN